MGNGVAAPFKCRYRARCDEAGGGNFVRDLPCLTYLPRGFVVTFFSLAGAGSIAAIIAAQRPTLLRLTRLDYLK